MPPTNVLSDDTCLALYFALAAARNGTTNVVISNENLKHYFFGMKAGKRLSEPKIKKFANALKPIFPRSLVKRTQHGPYLVLYLTEKPGRVEYKDHISPFVPPKSTVNEALGVQSGTN